MLLHLNVHRSENYPNFLMSYIINDFFFNLKKNFYYV